MRLRYKLSLCVLVAAVVVTGVVLLAAYGVLRHVRLYHRGGRLADEVRTSDHPEDGVRWRTNCLSLTLIVHNPNWAITVGNTERLEAAYTFDGQQFDDRVQLSDEGDKQPARETRVYRLVSGSYSNDYVELGKAAVPEYRKQNATGTFVVEMKLTGEFSYTARYTKCKLKATCPLKLRLLTPSSWPRTVVFEKVRCKLGKPEKFC